MELSRGLDRKHMTSSQNYAWQIESAPQRLLNTYIHFQKDHINIQYNQ